MGPLGKGL